jgi:hypothetical protein
MPSRADMRAAFREWAFTARARTAAGDSSGNGRRGEPPAAIAHTVRWIESHSVRLADLAKDDGGPVELCWTESAANRTAPSRRPTQRTESAWCLTTRWNTPVRSARFQRTPSIGLSGQSRVRPKQWTRALSSTAIRHGDSLPCRGTRRTRQPVGGVLRVHVLRGALPGEAIDLRRDNIVSLPPQGWGTLRLTNSAPRAGRKFTFGGKSLASL